MYVCSLHRYIALHLLPAQVIDPIKSRCLCLRIAAPSSESITAVLYQVAQREKFALPPNLAAKVVEQADGNLRRALLTLEACKA